jgi:NAD(P) transhydrogenase subunit alpha
MTVVRHGELTWPPPPVQVSSAPSAPAAPAEQQPLTRKTGPDRPASALRRHALVPIVGAALFLLAAFAPREILGHLTVFALAIVIGYYVIGNVHHALHTPLMSVTNAISGIIIVGALLQIGHDNAAITAVATLAILLASINVFGGFAVTRRMLAMFSRS